MLVLVLPYTECVEGAHPWLTPEFWGVLTGQRAEVQFGKWDAISEAAGSAHTTAAYGGCRFLCINSRMRFAA